MALQLGVSSVGVCSALHTQTYVWWWMLPSVIFTPDKCAIDLLTAFIKAGKLELLCRIIKKLLQETV